MTQKGVNKKAGTNTKTPLTVWKCGDCGTEFKGSKTSPICPECGENVNLQTLNQDLIPHNYVQPIVQPPVPEIPLSEDLDNAFRYDLRGSVHEALLERQRAHAAEAKQRRLAAEREIKQYETPTSLPPEGTAPNASTAQPSMPAIPNPNSEALMSSIFSMPKEDREEFLDRLKSDRDLAINLGLALNPPRSNTANGSGSNPFSSLNQGFPYPFFSQPQNQNQNQDKISDIAQAMKTLAETTQNQNHQEGQSQALAATDLANALKTVYEIASPQQQQQQQQPDLVSAVKEIIELTNAIRPPDNGNDDNNKLLAAINDLKENIVNSNHQQQQARENSSPVSEETIRKIIEEEGRKGTDIVEELKKAKQLINAVGDLSNTSVDDQIKKRQAEDQIAERQREHERELKKSESEKAKHETVGTILDAAMRQSFEKQHEKAQAQTQAKAAEAQAQKRNSSVPLHIDLAELMGESNSGLDLGQQQQEREEEEEKAKAQTAVKKERKKGRSTAENAD